MSMRTVVATGALSGIPTPVFSSALSFYDAYRSEWIPANLIQVIIAQSRLMFEMLSPMRSLTFQKSIEVIVKTDFDLPYTCVYVFEFYCF